MDKGISLKFLEEKHINNIVESTKGTNVSRGEEYLKRCLEECANNKRVTLVAFVGEDAAGIVNIVFESKYPYFKNNNIPEINDLLVVPKFRNRGVGKSLINEAEKVAAKTYDYIGLGVGLYKDYGSAQRLYVKNGYVPDGNGIIYDNKEVLPGNHVFLDDDLLIFLYKALR